MHLSISVIFSRIFAGVYRSKIAAGHWALTIGYVTIYVFCNRYSSKIQMTKVEENKATEIAE